MKLLGGYLRERADAYRINTNSFINPDLLDSYSIINNIRSSFSSRIKIPCNFPIFDGYLTLKMESFEIEVEVLTKPPEIVLNQILKIYNCSWRDCDVSSKF